MPEMNDPRREAAVLATHAATQQPDQQIGILAAPARKASVEAIDPFEIAAPDAEIAGACAAPLSSLELTQRAQRQPQKRRQPIDAPAQALPDPSPRAPCLRPQVIAHYRRRQRGGEQHSVSSDEPSRFGQLAMRRDEVGRNDAVAVEEDAIIAATGEYGTVADFGGAKAAMQLPDVTERNTKTRSPALHHGRRHRTRTVIRDHNLESAVGLARQRRQYGVKRVFAI